MRHCAVCGDAWQPASGSVGSSSSGGSIGSGYVEPYAALQCSAMCQMVLHNIRCIGCVSNADADLPSVDQIVSPPLFVFLTLQCLQFPPDFAPSAPVDDLMNSCMAKCSV